MSYFSNNNNSIKTSGCSSLDNSSDPDFSECLNEYILQSNSEPILHYEEGEMEAEWLVAAGFGDLTKPFEQGFELSASDLAPILASLSKPHADAVKQRVKVLNHTVRGRKKSRQKRKTDIRDIFRDIDDSRSPTPDSLDAVRNDTWNSHKLPNLESECYNRKSRETVDIIETENDSHQAHLIPLKYQKQKIRRTPSAPLKNSVDIFRGSHVRCDIPMNSAEGIELLGFSRIGTLHIPRIRSGSDPSCSMGRSRGKHIQDCQSDNNISSSDSCDELFNISASLDGTPQNIINKITLCTPLKSKQKTPSPKEGISFESMMREPSSQDGMDVIDCSEMCCDIDTISENDFKRLQAIFWLELATLFDRNHVSLDKRKPFKRRRKEDGNLFGVSLNALIRRDQQITGKDSNLVPLFLQGLLEELTKRGAKEEGILRVAGHKQKIELLYTELEAIFYQKPKKFTQLISNASVHDLCALLKRWLRELPQPLLTSELIQLFYQLHAIPPPDQIKALAVVCQMLPHENRKTLRSLIKFLNLVINHQDSNKMTVHNVSTIIAPSFFPPRYIHPTDKNSIEEQVKMAAQCCRLTNLLITLGDSLFQVPKHLTEQLKNAKSTRKGKRALHRRAKTSKSLTNIWSNENNELENVSMNRQVINSSHVHRLIV